MNKIDTEILGALLSQDDDDSPDAKECPMPKTKFPAELPFAMAYVPFQPWQKPYDTSAALERGTLFPCLDKPFIGEEAVKHDK